MPGPRHLFFLFLCLGRRGDSLCREQGPWGSQSLSHCSLPVSLGSVAMLRSPLSRGSPSCRCSRCWALGTQQWT